MHKDKQYEPIASNINAKIQMHLRIMISTSKSHLLSKIKIINRIKRLLLTIRIILLRVITHQLNSKILKRLILPFQSVQLQLQINWKLELCKMTIIKHSLLLSLRYNLKVILGNKNLTIM